MPRKPKPNANQAAADAAEGKQVAEQEEEKAEKAEKEEKEEKLSSKKESPSAVELASGKKPVTHLVS